MKVGTKVVSGLFVAIALLCLALVGLVQTVVVNSFKKLELQRFERNVARVQNGLSNHLEVLHKKVVDWGQWDNTYEFVASKNQSYVEENLNFMTLSALGFRDVLYFKNNGELVESAHVVTADQNVQATPADVAAFFKKIMSRGLEEQTKDGSGLAQINGETVLYAFTEILPSKRDSAGRGMLLVTSLVTNSLFKEWAYQTNLQLRFWRFTQETPSSQASIALQKLNAGENFVQMWSDDGKSKVFGLIRDFADQPAILFEFEDDNVVTRLAERVRNVAVLGVAIAGLLALLFMWWLVDRQILSRLSALSLTVQEIAKTGDSHLRLSDPSSYRRSLQLRALATVSACFILMGVSLWVVFEYSLVNAFQEIERSNLLENVTRAERALEARTQELLGKTEDWAQWDDTYEFVLNQDKEYIETNLNYETLSALHLKAVAYFSTSGDAVYGLEANTHLASTANLTPELAEILKQGMPSIRAGETKELQAGLLKTPVGIIMVTRSPILDSERSKPSRGSFVFVMSVDQNLVDELSKQTKLDIGIYPPSLKGTQPEQVEVVDQDNIIGRTVVRGLDGNEVAVIQVTLKRYVHILGLSARKTLLLCLAVCSVVATLLASLLVYRVIVAALKSSVREIQEISLSGDASKRLSITGQDELGVLAQQINSMLETLARTQDELQKARDEAQAANQAKSTFIAKVSHELRTPIHGIVGMLRILLKEESSSTKKSYISMAKNSAFSLLDTINEILDFSKVETGNLSLEQIDFTLRTVVREALSTVAPRAEEKDSLELVVDVFHDLPDTFVGDPLRLKQCLINLLGNAIKFTKEGFVKLELRSGGQEGDKHRILVSVSDSGVGIPAERLPRIFDPFTQADDSVARLFAGTGLGLTIVKQLVEQMGGTVEVQSEVGKGTTFTLSIPLPCTADAQQNDRSLSVIPPRVAIIDDTSYTLETFKAGLSRHQIACHHVSPNDTRGLTTLSTQIADYGLVLVTSNAIKRSRVFNLVVEVAAQKIAPLAVILSPFEIAVRERLAALNIPYIMMRPISLEDIILAVAGELDLSKTEWEQEDDVLLVQSRKLRVLIADDAETNRIILSSMLKEAGHEVVCVENGLDLVAALEGQITDPTEGGSFDIVLTDIQMPMMDGLSATQRVRALEAAHGSDARIPIVAVTAHAMTNETDRMRACGVDDVVTKPIHPSELARALSSLTGSAPAKPSSPQNTRAFTADTDDDDEIDPQAAKELQSLQDTSFRMWKQLRSEQAFLDFESAEDEIPFAQVLDIADVFERAGDSSRRTRLIFSAFLGSFKEPLSELTKAKSASDTKGLTYSAHALKGLLLDIGAKTSGKLASSIEQFGKQDNFAEGAALVTELGNQVLVVARLVQKIVDAWPVDSGERPVV